MTNLSYTYMKVVYYPKVWNKIVNLSKIHNSRIIRVIDLFKERGFFLTELHLKKLKNDIWELRAGRYRLLFGVIGTVAVITNIFMKKTQKTPKQEIMLAVRRLKEYEK